MSLNWTRTHPTDHDLDLTPTLTRTSCLVFSGRVFFNQKYICYLMFCTRTLMRKWFFLNWHIAKNFPWYQCWSVGGCKGVYGCVLLIPQSSVGADSRGFLGFSVSELTDKCPYMDGFFFNVLTTWPPCWRCQHSPAGHFMQSMHCAAWVSTHACPRVGQQETCDWGVIGLLLMWFNYQLIRGKSMWDGWQPVSTVVQIYNC